jgi:protein-S-isoprenylcysteine O-methyltransferase Ste14
MSEHTNKPGIRLIPPLVYLIALAIGYGLERLWPLFKVPSDWTIGAGVAAICLSVILVVPAIASFRKAGTPFDIRKPATSLVTNGPYRYSRNPGYLALTLLYVGLALVLGSAWALIFLVPALVIMHYGVVIKEETHLERQFGEAYLRYKSSVRRWL